MHEYYNSFFEIKFKHLNLKDMIVSVEHCLKSMCSVMWVFISDFVSQSGMICFEIPELMHV